VDIVAWLRGLSLPQYEQAFRSNDIGAELLPTLTEADLREIGVASLGHRRRLLEAIAALRGGAEGTAPVRGDDGRPGPPRAPAEPQAERRQLTVVFADLVGSTALARGLDPEELRELLHAYEGVVTGEVARLGGHVAKFMGDGILACFGWPRGHEDDAERAVRAGLELNAAVGQLQVGTSSPLAARVAIATGLVMVGELIGEGAAKEQTVVGETPNLAARLQALAAPGSLVISEATRRLVGGLFELTDFGPRRLKGFAEPLSAWRVEGEGRAEGRFEALHGERLTPLVGREHELGILLERWTWPRTATAKWCSCRASRGSASRA
jgi:class 3 adenylate cyclase